MRRLKINREDDVEVGSVVKYRVDGKTTVGEVYNILSNEKYEIIIYDKRLKPVNRHDGSFKIKKIPAGKCKLIDENFRFNTTTILELGDIICKKTAGSSKFGLITGFQHPDGLLSTSYENGYNGTDLIDCVEIEKRGLRRKRSHSGEIVRFTTTCERVSACEVDLWNRSGPKIIGKQ
jgi:hypothetical protein